MLIGEVEGGGRSGLEESEQAELLSFVVLPACLTLLWKPLS